MESKNAQYRKALQEINHLCYCHIGDKHDFTIKVMKLTSEALKKRTNKKPNSTIK